MSHSILDQLNASMTPQLFSEAAKALGESPDATEQAIHLALPALLSGIAAATRMPSGLSAVLRLVEDPVNDGTLSTQLTSLYKGTMSASPIYRLGSQLLNAILGGKLTQLSQGVAALSGIKTGSANTLLHMLAPNILTVLGNDHRAVADKSPEGFARFIERQKAGLAGTLAPTLAEIVQAPMGVVTPMAAPGPAVGTTLTQNRVPGGLPMPKDQQVPRRIEAAAHGAAVKPVITGTPKQPAEPTSVRTFADTATAGAGTPGAGGDTGRKRVPGEWEPGTKPMLVFLTLLGLGLMLLTFGLSKEMAPQEKLATKAATPAAVTGPTMPDSSPVPAPQKAAGAKPAATPQGTAQPAPKVAEASKAGSASAPAVTPPKYVGPAGVTTYFGSTPKSPEAAAIANPGYRASTLAPRAVEGDTPTVVDMAASNSTAALPVTPPGVTSFYGQGRSSSESPAIANPDYEPAVAVAAVPPIVVPEDHPVAPMAGTTSYFGSEPAREEAPAAANPDYKPATPMAAAATVDATGEIEDKRATPVPGVTSYFGVSAAPAEAPATANPAYKPAAVLATAVATPRTQNRSATGADLLKPQSGVTTYFGRAAAAHTPRAGTAATPATCAQSLAEAVKSGVVLFGSGRADLTASSLPTLKRVARAFKHCPGMQLRIEGHTDDTGSADMNLRLSQARAKSVANYLVLRGIDAARVVSTGLGMTQPVAPNSTAANKALNRRIEFKADAF